MNNFIKPKTFKSDVQSLLDSADNKGLFIHGLFFDGENMASITPDNSVEWQAKLTAVLIQGLVDANGSDLDIFIEKLLAEVSKLKED